MMQRRLLAIWVLLLIVAAATGGYHVAKGLKLDSNFISMLPPVNDGGWLAQAKLTVNRAAARRVVLLLSQDDGEKVATAARSLRRDLTQGGFVLASVEAAKGASRAPDWRCAARFLLSARNRDLLRTGRGEKIARRALAQIISPFSPVNRELLRQDPFLLFANYLNALPLKISRLGDGKGLVTWIEDGRHFALLQLRLAQDPFSNKSLEGFVSRLAQLGQALQRAQPDLKILKTGAVFYGARSIAKAETEAQIIGSISIAAIVAMCLLVFRSPRPILLTLLAVGAGVLVGGAAVLAVFGKIHAIALVFGAGMIGVSVDYAFHYCVQRFAPGESAAGAGPVDWLRQILQPLSLGLISTVAGFATLALSPFPGLQQISLFAAAGLIAAYLTVLAVFPLLDRPGHWEIWLPLRQLGGGLLAVLEYAFHSVAGRACLVVALVALMVLGAVNFKIDDDIRRLQVLPQELQRQEAEIRLRSGIDTAAQFFLLRGRDREATLRAEELLEPKLRALVAAGELGGFHMVSQFLPSRRRRAENEKLIMEQLYGPHLENHLSTLGLSDFRHPECSAAKTSLPGPARQLLIGEPDAPPVHLIALRGIGSLAPLRQLAAQTKNLDFVDYASDISDLLTRLRQQAFWPLGLACLGIWVLLSLVQGPRQALRIVAIPMAAVFLTPLITSAFGGVFTLFNAMALVLVFVIGLDYAIFLAHAPARRYGVVALANALAAFSTIMAFGLLAFSSHYAVHAFGVTVLTGIALAFVLSFLAPASRS